MKIRKISDEELKKINEDALIKLDTLEIKKGRKSESEEFLKGIEEVLKKALDKEIPFTQMVKLIKELYNVNVSVNIVKSYAVNHLGYEPKTRKKANGVVKAIDKNRETIKRNAKTVKEMKAEQADTEDDEDSL